MRTDNLLFAVAASIVIGFAQTMLLVYCWVYISLYTPVPHWLLSLGLRGVPHQAVLFVLDFTLSVILCLPAAFILSRLRPRKLLVYLTAAVIPGFVWQYSLVFQEPSVFRDYFSLFVPGILSALLILPVAVFVVVRVGKPAHA